MNSKTISPRFIVLAGMVLAAAFVRLIPHPPNFAPIAAMALFSGAYFTNKKLALIIPLVAMFITDAIIGFHETMYAVYLSFALIVLIGIFMIHKKKIGNIILASVSASVSFFIITNFAQWISDPFYTKDAAGLAACFTAAIPFFHYTYLGDLVFVGLLFGSFEFAKAKFPRLSTEII